MEQKAIEVIEACAAGSHNGTLHFPDVVKQLMDIGIAQYHADFLRAETTYYGQGDQSHIVQLTLPTTVIAHDFRRDEVAAAIQAAQKEGLPYTEFLARVTRAGCIGYSAYIDGQRVIYFGRLGDMHIEYFPGSPFARQTS